MARAPGEGPHAGTSYIALALRPQYASRFAGAVMRPRFRFCLQSTASPAGAAPWELKRDGAALGWGPVQATAD